MAILLTRFRTLSVPHEGTPVIKDRPYALECLYPSISHATGSSAGRRRTRTWSLSRYSLTDAALAALHVRKKSALAYLAESCLQCMMLWLQKHHATQQATKESWIQVGILRDTRSSLGQSYTRDDSLDSSIFPNHHRADGQRKHPLRLDHRMRPLLATEYDQISWQPQPLRKRQSRKPSFARRLVPTPTSVDPAARKPQ